MEKKSAPYYISAGILFGISGIVSKYYVLAILGMALMVIGFVMKKEKSN